MRTFAFCLVLLTWVLVAVPSYAAEASAADRATARSLALEGYQALQKKDYPMAIDRFSRADQLVHAPTLVVDWARSLVGVGKLVEAMERYELVIREGVPAKAPKSWQQALSDAQNELEALKPRLAWVTINVRGEPAAVTIDAVEVPEAALGVRRPVNPGPRVIRATAHGFLAFKRRVEFSEGAEQSVDIELERDPDAQPESAPAPPPPPPPPADVQSTGGGRRTLTYLALGVAGVGLVGGVATGAVALKYRGDLDCPGGPAHCPPSQQATIDKYNLFGSIALISLGAGVVGGITGLTLLLTAPKSDKPQASHGFAAQPYVGVGSVGVVGAF